MAAESKQPRCGQLWLLARQGRQRRGPVAEVAVALRRARLYAYAVPAPLAGRVQPGVAVRVPYGAGGRLVDGWCLRVSEGQWQQTLKPVAAVSHPEPLLSPALIELGLWLSEYYACPPGQTFAAMVPKALRRPKLRKVSYVRATGQAPTRPLTARQRRLLEVLGAAQLPRNALLARAEVGPAVLGKLRARGLLEVLVCREAVPLPGAAPGAPRRPRGAPPAEESFELTAGQRQALQAVTAAAAPGEFVVFLLFGVPGSGKTEVYVRAIRDVVARGRQAIMLVPEIALATQVVERLSRRFERVAVLHSRLRPRARLEAWRRVQAGAVDVVIGTRSAVFAPCRRPGLIVVDEEQEKSFKSLAAPFYHARDVAIKRGQIERIPVLLGSATPSLESWHNAQLAPHFRLLRLPQRVCGARLPRVRLVSTGRRELGQASELLSPELVLRLAETLRAGEQAILLHNRRGYAVHLRCKLCGLTLRCPGCDVPLVYHRDDRAGRPGSAETGGRGMMKCHRCGRRGPAPSTCLDDTCRGALQRSGLAIQRLAEELSRMFPQARLLRLDSDAVRQREDYLKVLTRFERRQADILLGTQMVAKGLDFPHVRLVGVIDADAALGLPDFRAAEHVFQLLVQVVGRAGRRRGASLALIQSRDITVPLIRHAVRLDYESFAAAELADRRRAFYPPFARLVRCVCADARPGRARVEAQRLCQLLRGMAGRVQARIRVEQAEPCPAWRARGMFRAQVLVRGPRDDSMRRLFRLAVKEQALSPRVRRFTIDVDPLEML